MLVKSIKLPEKPALVDFTADFLKKGEDLKSSMMGTKADPVSSLV